MISHEIRDNDGRLLFASDRRYRVEDELKKRNDPDLRKVTRCTDGSLAVWKPKS